MINIKNLVFAAVVLAASACNTQVEKPMEKPKEKAIDMANMDLSLNPGDDFFRYANGGWMKSNPIPEEYSRFGAFEVLDKLNKDRIKTIIDEVSVQKEAKKGSPAQQIRDFYLAAMDTAAIDALGYSPIKPLFEKVEKLENAAQIPELIAELNFKGIYPAFVLYGGQDDKNSERVIAHVLQGGLSLPDRDYYTKTDPSSEEIRSEFVNHLIKMHELIGSTPEEAKTAAQIIMKFETRLAKASMTLLERRDPNAVYNLMSVADFAKSVPNFDFISYISALGINDIKEVNIGQPKFFAELNKMMKDVPLNDWKIYLNWQILNESSSLLSSEIEQTNFNFFGKTLSGTEKMQERWKRMISAINGNLGEAMGKLYVEKYFPQEAKDKMLKLVANLKIALGESIKNLDWMSAPTKVKALEKLESMTVKVGYPNKWIDYSSIEISANNYIQNNWNCNEFNYRDNLKKIGKPVDREEWGMTPQTVNAYYSPNMNEIVFPAAILQPPFFDLNADDAVNYGAIGVVIGHEMTHGFDDQGRLYDKNGNLNDWWTEEDATKFKEKTQILVEQFNNYILLDSLHIDGELTLGENIADNGGLLVAHEALLRSFEQNGVPKPVDSLSYDQRFFISYAQVWRQNIRDKELMRRIKEDVHSPGEARVNAGVANMPWWYSAFNIAPESKYYIAPEKRAKIW
jgi:putative endopeptidase